MKYILILSIIILTVLLVNEHYREKEAEIIYITYIVPAIEQDSSGVWNSTQFQRAIELQQLMNVDGVLIPPGVFSLETAITIPGNINITIDGGGHSLLKSKDSVVIRIE